MPKPANDVQQRDPRSNHGVTWRTPRVFFFGRRCARCFDVLLSKPYYLYQSHVELTTLVF